MRIEDDNGLSDFIKSTEETKICGGFTFTEGPIWVPSDQALLFSDIPANRIHRWRPGATEAEIYREPSRNSNGLTLDAAGNVLACEHSGRQVSRGPYDGPEQTVADRFEGKRFNSPNDVIVHSSGAIYFTDPPYGLGPDDVKELPYQGVYRIAADGTLTCIETSFTAPNGLAFSPDESVLYIGDAKDRIIKRYRVNDDGSLADGELFVDQREDPRPKGPDGMKVDEDGRLWTTGAGGVSVFQPDGTKLGLLVVAEHAANVAFGGPDFSTLFLTALTSVYSVETVVRGIGPGSRG